MRTSLTAVLIIAGLVMTGCTRDDQLKHDHDKLNNKATTHSMSKGDACAHCDGSQMATAAGTCPVCGMKLH